ncbi:uncharacterized protein F54H12.2-like [Paramacrobiotus metropolitanus]|uniref:uncharacterized protein F54H12.2-like n=1 Tax=Paramacrobiotus metropolitanus TaxID=2943436 RepID=UPI0024459185|nr:uncharacterized protein F54H12.2-like [Paramacrobiotus metropolitanus]
MNTNLTTGGFYLDTSGYLNSPVNNNGAQRRKDLFTNNGWVELSGRLFTDITMQDKPLLPGVSMGIKFIMSKPEFHLQTYAAPTGDKTTATQGTPEYEYRTFLRNPCLYLKRYIPTPDYLTAITQMLGTKTAKYHIERTLMRVHDITKSTQSTVVANLHIGQIPKVMFIGFVSNASFHGSQDKNPFNFENFSITAIAVEVDGQSYPAKPYQPDFVNGRSLECYNGLMDTLGRKNSSYGHMPFSRIGYQQGFTIFGFDLTPEHTGRGAMTLIRQGNLAVRVAFAKPLSDTVMMCTMLVMDNLVEFNQHRNLIADFTS